MAKIISLYINELTKISRKISVYVILIVMLAGMFVTGGLLKYSQDRRQSEMTNTNIEQFMKSDMESRLTNLQTQLSQTNDKIKSASPSQKGQLELAAANLGYQIDGLKTALDMNVYLYTNYYVAKAINTLAAYKTEAGNLQVIPEAALTQTQKDEKELLASLIPKLEKVISDKNFSEYTAVISQKIEADTTISAKDKDIQIEQNNLRLKYNVTNEDKNNRFGKDHMSSTADDIINNIGLAKRSLAYNLDFSADQNAPVPLTNERRAQLNDNIAVYLKQLGTGSFDTNNFTFMNYILEVGTFMIGILLMILAGSAISQEISTGSVKSLIITPTRRWKIYISKLISLITVGIAAAIICYFIGITVYGTFFGLKSISPYIYVSSGSAVMMNFYLFTFIKLFVGLIKIAFYMVLALMLSTITRNTAASVGVSIGVFFGGSIAYSVLTQLLTGEWLKFLPFANFDFSTKIFTFDPSISAATDVTTSIAFSTVYIVLTICLMFYIGLDSFNRRDIK